MKKLGILVATVIALGSLGIAKIDETTAGGGWQASHPAIWNNLIIAPLTMSGPEGTHRSAVCGINSESGAVEWKFEAPDRIFSSAGVEGDKVYIVLPHNKYPYRYLTCLNAKTGELIKEVPFEKATYNRPLIKDGLIYIGTTGISQGRGTVECYDLDLNFKWTFESISSTQILDGWVYGLPGYEVIDGKAWLFIGSHNSQITPIDAKTGKAKPLLWKNTVFQTNGSGTYNFWDSQINQQGGPIENDILVKDGKIWFGAMDGFAYCLNAKDGQRVWKFEDTRDPKDNTKDNAKIATNIRFSRSSPLVIGDSMFLGAQAVSDNKFSGLYQVNASTGAVMGFFKTSDYVSGSPVLVGNNLVFGCDNGSIYCINQSLAEVWKTTVGGGSTGCKPILNGDKLYFCVREPAGVIPQKIVCINTSGQLVWKTEQFK
jgi:outer membrane protein assembly factor BamB